MTRYENQGIAEPVIMQGFSQDLDGDQVRQVGFLGIAGNGLGQEFTIHIGHAQRP
jgi:hypothetical protein